MSDENNENETEQVVRHEAKVGRFDGTLNIVAFNEGDSVATILQKAGFSNLGEGESVNDDDGNEVNTSDQATADMTYYIVGNYKQGK